MKWAEASMQGFWRLQKANMDAAARTTELFASSYARAFGATVDPVMAGTDNRFRHVAWHENLALDVLRQSYLITAQWLADTAEIWQGADPALAHRVRFWVRQYADALSPTNYPATNPEVIEETIRTGGQNLVHGMQNLIRDIQLGRVSQVPEGSFQVGKDLACTPGKVVYRNKLIELLQYEAVTDEVHAVPILAIPPWINKFYVMDMSPGNSMFKFLTESGFTVFTISWKNPGSDLRDMEWEDYMALGPLEALRAIKAITGADRVNLIGYCLGGMMLQTTLAYLAGIGDPSVSSASFFATHQDAENVGDIAAFISEPEVRFLGLLMELSGGYLDGRNMAATFNLLRSNDLFWSYVINNYMMGKQPPEFDLLYWNSDGTRVPKTVHMFLLRNFFLEDNFSKPGFLSLKGVPLDVSRIATPTYTVATVDDHIVPWRGAFVMHDRVAGPVRLVLGESGHIAGIINHPVEKKRGYWTNDAMEKNGAGRALDPDAWLSGATHYQGSWWEDWIPWLANHSGEMRPPPSMGNDEFAPLMDAPGTYVLEK